MDVGEIEIDTNKGGEERKSGMKGECSVRWVW